ncbi:alpha-ketoglutarate-dependent dioxygenase AlkB [Neptunicella marina]|uniref:Alpha-ketoglutarate-dependent dioxygenase AlkB n=1 Tax=Neptunicella marina TaxID=2125989 RepID=A0A8J6IP60_9ALTE|nr:alpha-ketoglutarate-dependent dioxygenase AlkB [Neptunicella marina]
MKQFTFDLTQNSDIPLPQANIRYFSHFIQTEQAENVLRILTNELQWRQDYIRLYGREHKIPRLQAWYGDVGTDYQYSGLKMNPIPWHPLLLQLKKRCEVECATLFNSVLCNYYRDGQDSMGMHSDDESELGIEPTIASLSFGQPRILIFKHKSSGKRHKIELEHGSLLVMAGATQTYWQHGIDKTRRNVAPRLNLTFRHIKRVIKRVINSV